MTENSQGDMIEVKSDKLHGFSQLLTASLMYGAESKEVLQSFGAENSGLQALPDSFSRLFSDKHNQSLLGANIGRIGEGLRSGEISTPEQLADTFTAGMNGAENEKQAIMRAYTEYADFCDKHQGEIEQTRQFMQGLQNDQQYGWNQELHAVNNFFHLPEGQKYNLYLNPYASNTLGSGVFDKSSDSINMNYSLAHTEPEENYLRGSNILSRRASTPFHEATHAAFERSPLLDKIKNNKALQDMLTAMNEQYGSPANSTTHGLLSEGFAAASTAVMDNKLTGKPAPNGEFYHGWKAADRLARCIYPVFSEYLEQGRPMDDAFLQRVVEKGNNMMRMDAKVQSTFANRHAGAKLEERLNAENKSNAVKQGSIPALALAQSRRSSNLVG